MWYGSGRCARVVEKKRRWSVWGAKQVCAGEHAMQGLRNRSEQAGAARGELERARRMVVQNSDTALYLFTTRGAVAVQQALKDALAETRAVELRWACQGALFQIAQFNVSHTNKARLRGCGDGRDGPAAAM